MPLTATDWVKLNRLLDEALDLEPAQRTDWMESLPAEYASLRETLRDLLFRQAHLETADVLRRVPALAVEELAPVKDGDRIGPYRILRQIGSGGMSTVWLAERADGSLERREALKLPRVSLLGADLADRILRERDILASLEHPGIARLYDAGVDNGRPFLAMEYVDGVPLDRFVAENGVTLRQRLKLFEQVASAVGCAHARLIVHRDLKPANVLVRADGDARLLDFGIAGLLAPERVDTAKPLARAFTPRYAAPEQFAGETVTVATDIYSLGVILYELLTGVSPYPVKTSGARDDDPICFEILPMSPRVDRRTARVLRGDLEAIVGKALAVDPAERYDSVGALLNDLERYRRRLPIRARRDTFTYRAGLFARRHALAVGLSSALLLAIIVGIAASVTQMRIAMHERDRAVRLLEQSQATNEFWGMLFTEGVSNTESVSMPVLLERSEAMAEQALAAAPRRYLVAVDAISGLYMSHDRPEKVESLVTRALATTNRIPADDPLRQQLRCRYAMAISYGGRFAEADAILRDVLATARDSKLRQYCLHRRAIVARDNGEPANALSYIQQARQVSLAEPIQSEYDSALQLADLAYAYALNGDSAAARRTFAESIRLYEKLGRAESYNALTVLNNWGNLELDMGQPSGALEHYQRALAIAVKRSPGGEAPGYLLGNYAQSLRVLGRFEEALREFEKLEQWARRDGNLRSIEFALSGAADSHVRIGDADAAERVLARATRAGDATNHSPASIGFRVVQGKVFIAQGKAGVAYDLLSGVLRDLGSRAPPAALIGPLAQRARASIASGRAHEAVADATRAFDIAKQVSGGGEHSSVIGFTALVRGEAELADGARTAAAQSLRVAVEHLRPTVGDVHMDTQRAVSLLRDL
jgi:serine/threonine protein kinase/tetratricopeptide (TPR) repeat protein